ncbi:MAG: hypothetical protein C5B43_01575 [Verrucomicrobia bacterium]|nr:MAG: hypothetical protein C5B43_01575 [Verrucomicrobiota bacterium]
MKKKTISFTNLFTSKKSKTTNLLDSKDSKSANKNQKSSVLTEKGNTSTRVSSNETITNKDKPLTQRTAEEIEKEIKKTEINNFSKEIVNPSRAILIQTEYASPKEILSLANNYYSNKQFSEANLCLQRIEALYSSSLDKNTKIQLFEKIIDCYKKFEIKNSGAIIHYCDEILSLIDDKSHKAIQIYLEIYDCYLDEDDSENYFLLIPICKKLLAIPSYHDSGKNIVFDHLLELASSIDEDAEQIFSNLYELSLELKNFNLNKTLFDSYLSKIIDEINDYIDNHSYGIQEKIIGFKFLIEIYKNDDNENAIFQTHARICALPNLSTEYKTQILFDITAFYLYNNQLSKALEYSSKYCNHILNLIDLNEGQKFCHLESLLYLHLQYENLEVAISIYKITLDLFWNKNLIIDFLKNSQIGFEQYASQIQQMPLKIQELFLEVLAYSPDLWYGSSKLSDSQWNRVFETQINEETINYNFVIDLLYSQQ